MTLQDQERDIHARLWPAQIHGTNPTGPFQDVQEFFKCIFHHPRERSGSSESPGLGGVSTTIWGQTSKHLLPEGLTAAGIYLRLIFWGAYTFFNGKEKSQNRLAGGKTATSNTGGEEQKR